MFRIEMLPAAHGDCLWLEYGTGESVHRILVDGGPGHCYPALRERILHLAPDNRRFDLLVVTHIDADHIEGIVRLLQDAEALHCEFDRIWFNGREQLNAVPDTAGHDLGAAQGEYLGLLIRDYESRTGRTVWNVDLPTPYAAFDPAADALPVITLPGDCRLTLLSPDPERLLELKDRWDEELRKADIDPDDEDALRRRLASNNQLQPLGDVLGDEPEALGEGRFELPDPDDRDLPDAFGDVLGDGDGEPGADADFGGDGSIANGSSIALLVEYPAADPDVRALLSGDAWAEVLESALVKLLGGDDRRLSLDLFKLPHHGSVANVTESLLARLSCKHYLISTSGARFRHPHARAVELLLAQHKHRAHPRLHFNYLTITTQRWSDRDDQEARKYRAFHPRGLSLELP
jgi:beta-lactamase superfamily II metal-dependent hydrolase